jgi:hypothetical protein
LDGQRSPGENQLRGTDPVVDDREVVGHERRRWPAEADRTERVEVGHHGLDPLAIDAVPVEDQMRTGGIGRHAADLVEAGGP